MDDRALMERALRLAERGRGRTAPNPMVGAVVGAVLGASLGGAGAGTSMVGRATGTSVTGGTMGAHGASNSASAGQAVR